MRLIQKMPRRGLVRLSAAAAVLIAALATSGCLRGGPGGVTYYQYNIGTGCKVTAKGTTVCPGGRTAESPE